MGWKRFCVYKPLPSSMFAQIIFSPFVPIIMFANPSRCKERLLIRRVRRGIYICFLCTIFVMSHFLLQAGHVYCNSRREEAREIAISRIVTPCLHLSKSISVSNFCSVTFLFYLFNPPTVYMFLTHCTIAPFRYFLNFGGNWHNTKLVCKYASISIFPNEISYFKKHCHWL